MTGHYAALAFWTLAALPVVFCLGWAGGAAMTREAQQVLREHEARVQALARQAAAHGVRPRLVVRRDDPASEPMVGEFIDWTSDERILVEWADGTVRAEHPDTIHPIR